MLGAEIAPKGEFYFRTKIRDVHNLNISGGTIIGDNAFLDARCGLRIGNNVNLLSNVSIYALQHDHRDPDAQCIWDTPITIGDRVWLGSNVIILIGVKIGEGAI